MIYTVTFNPAIDYIIRLDKLTTGAINRVTYEQVLGGGFKDTTRIASSNADMWADICMTNGEAISTHLRDLQKILGDVIVAIENHDRKAVYDYFAKSKERRDKILEAVAFDPN